jgi:hypothetical protein
MKCDYTEERSEWFSKALIWYSLNSFNQRPFRQTRIHQPSWSFLNRFSKQDYLDAMKQLERVGIADKAFKEPMNSAAGSNNASALPEL